MCPSLTNWGEWRRKCSVDSTSFPLLHSGFNVSWKPCLNLCSFKWLKSILSLVIRQIPLRLWHYKQSLEMNLSYELKKIAFQTKKLSDFLRSGSKLSHSIMINGKKEFWKSCVLCLEGWCEMYFESSKTSI